MNNKIQELTDIIYNEGVAKGQAQADEILSQAKLQAEKMIRDARQQADSIIAAAEKQNAASAENVRKELKLHAQQAVSSLKSEIATAVTDRIVKDAVAGFTADKDTFAQLVLAVARSWNGSQTPVIESAQAEQLKAFFVKQAKDLLDGGLEIRQVSGRPAHFSIQPADGSYRVNFGDEEIENWLKSMLRDQLVEILF